MSDCGSSLLKNGPVPPDSTQKKWNVLVLAHNSPHKQAADTSVMLLPPFLPLLPELPWGRSSLSSPELLPFPLPAIFLPQKPTWPAIHIRSNAAAPERPSSPTPPKIATSTLHGPLHACLSYESLPLISLTCDIFISRLFPVPLSRMKWGVNRDCQIPL